MEDEKGSAVGMRPWGFLTDLFWTGYDPSGREGGNSSSGLFF